MKNLLVHPFTLSTLQATFKSPPHALLLAGPAGSGKKTLAEAAAEQILSLAGGGLSAYPYKLIVAPEKNQSIGIETVRELERFLNLIVPGNKTGYNRAIIVKDSHNLTVEAQNSLLKTLEEPPEGTVLIMTASSEQALLPTIRSRVQLVAVKRPSLQAAEDYFVSQGFNADEVKRAYTISGGAPGLMRALLSNADHPLNDAVKQARLILSQSLFERLVAVDELSRQKDLTMNMLLILQQMARVSLKNAEGTAAKKWQNVLTASYEASTALASSAQAKLVLTSFMLSF